jgi:hypothetical protein
MQNVSDYIGLFINEKKNEFQGQTHDTICNHYHEQHKACRVEKTKSECDLL